MVNRTTLYYVVDKEDDFEYFVTDDKSEAEDIVSKIDCMKIIVKEAG